MSLYPHKPSAGQRLQTNAPGVTVDEAFIAHLQVSAVKATAADTNGVHAAVTDTGEEQVIETGFTQPSVARNITATAGGTAGDIKAVQVIVEGTNEAGEIITETLPAFTVNTAGSVAGSKAFKTVTSVTLPAHDGTGATTEIGFGEKLGLPSKLSHNTVLFAYLGNTKEGTAPTVTVSAAAVEDNTVDLNSSLNGTAVDVYYLV
jgi:LysM repeat protein